MKKRAVSAVLSVLFILTLLLPAVSPAAAEEAAQADYPSAVFDASYVHTVDILISEEDWADLLQNPLEKTKYNVTAVIDGESYEGCSFATKGNTSLSSVANSESDRYSFKLNFGKYNKGQTCHGLDKMHLNNCYADPTYMKDYFSYRIISECGADAPLCAYASLSVNGEAAGLYLMVESVDESFLARTREDPDGVLYKPEAANLDRDGNGAGDPGGMPFGEGFAFPEEGGEGFPQMPFGEGFTLPEEGTEAQGAGGFPQMPFGEGFTFPEEGTEAQGAGGFPQMPSGEGLTPPETGSDAQSTAAPEGGEGFPQTPSGENGAAPGTPPEEGAAPSEDGADTQSTATPRAGETGGDFGGMRGGFGRSFDFGDRERGGFGMGNASSAASLVYTDDSFDSYADIFDNAETDIDDGDRERLISALKTLAGEDALSAVDVENVAAYFAGHHFTVNLDSWTGSMLHNYFLYEDDGVLSVFPWDYNLAFGTFQGSDFSGAVNASIYSPLSGGVSDADRPLWNAILKDEGALAAYSDALGTLVSDYFDSGRFAGEIDALYALLRPYVAEDPTAFSTVEAFDKGVETLKAFCLLRAESVANQLEGDAAKVDTGTWNASDMGSFGGGRGQQDRGRQEHTDRRDRKAPGGSGQTSPDTDPAAGQQEGD